MAEGETHSVIAHRSDVQPGNDELPKTMEGLRQTIADIIKLTLTVELGKMLKKTEADDDLGNNEREMKEMTKTDKKIKMATEQTAELTDDKK